MVHNKDRRATSSGLEFLWLELTNRCNLQCVHCYANSAPQTQTPNTLSTADYTRLIDEAAELGCRQLQFIGGEPTLNRDLPVLIAHAADRGFSFIEVFTNLTHLSDALLECFVHNGVRVATSVYSHHPEVHDRITTRDGSFTLTMANIDRVIAAELDLRAGLIVMDHNKGDLGATFDFLRSRGIQNVGTDRVRGIGRGASGEEPVVTELCGACWMGKLCVGPDGTVSPCIMSKPWAVGSVTNNSLSDILESDALLRIRERIRKEVWLPNEEAMRTGCKPDKEQPCYPETCAPPRNSGIKGHCGPMNCNPYYTCTPEDMCDPWKTRP